MIYIINRMKQCQAWYLGIWLLHGQARNCYHYVSAHAPSAGKMPVHALSSMLLHCSISSRLALGVGAKKFHAQLL